MSTLESVSDLTPSGGGVRDLSFLNGVQTISGYLRIRNCANLTSLDALASLQTIGGTATIGLYIWNNPLLTNLLVRVFSF